MLSSLSSLEGLSPSAAEAALSNLALHSTDAIAYGTLGETEKRLADELWDSTGVAEPREREAKFFDLLNAALDEVSGRTDEEKIKKAAGKRGDLWPSLYRVTLPAHLERLCRQMRLAPHLAIEAVQDPEAVDHLNPESFGFPEETPYSISLRFHGTSLKRHGIVALSERKGDELVIGQIWMFFVQDLDLANARRPIDVLRAFAERYGTDIVVAGERAKFILYRVVPLPTAGEPTEAIRFASASGGRNLSSMIYKIDTIEKNIKIGVAYNVDVLKYASDLRRHGVRPKSDLGNLGSAPQEGGI